MRDKGLAETYINVVIKRFRPFFKYCVQEGYIDEILLRIGRPPTVETVERALRQIGKKAGKREKIRCSLHTCRHYFAQA